MSNTPSVKLPVTELNVVRKNQPAKVKIAESRIATLSSSPNIIRHITFDLGGSDLEGKFLSGQSIGVIPPVSGSEGKPESLRLYSISSPSDGEDGKGRFYSTTVKRLIAEHWETQDLYTGLCSNYLCKLREGDEVLVTGPSGKRFLLPDNYQDFKYVFFATGTGIAPFRGMIMDLVKRGHQNKMVLAFGSPYRTDLLYYPYFSELDKKIENFSYLSAVSREEPRANGQRPYVQSLIEDRADILEPVLKQSNTLIYICGIKGMETGIFRELGKKGLTEYFTFKKDIDSDPDKWDDEIMKKAIKPGDRMFLEVY
ncbi:MAG: hypothetical protein LAT67_09920 [Balneolales bacterium]|nr:hypothetical protein [Balneolales bacterium]